MEQVADNIASDLKSKLIQFGMDADIVAGANKFSSRLAKINTASQLATFLHSAGSIIGKFGRSGGTISVQPGSIQRRRPGVTRGAKRVPPGRRSAAFGQAPSKKRKHNLALNEGNNVPNGH